MFTTETVYIRKCWVLKIMIDYFECWLNWCYFPLHFVVHHLVLMNKFKITVVSS